MKTSMNEKTYRITGKVIDRTSGEGVPSLRVEVWDKDLIFDDFLCVADTNATGSFQMEFSESSFRNWFFDRRPDLYFKIYQARELLWSTEGSVLWNIDSELKEITIEVDAGLSIGNHESLYSVTGRAASPGRAGIGGLRVLIVDKNVGQDVTLAVTVTDANGRYRISFTADSLPEGGKAQPDLQARVYAGDVFLAASEVRYNAALQETLNVTLPANSAALPSEYETMIGAISAQYKGKLSELKESEEQQDITFLANKTGWDARAVALAALADRFSEFSPNDAGTIGIAAPFYYALFRAGLPANPDTLYQTDASTVERVWKQAIEQGVIPKDQEQEIAGAIQIFQKLNVEKMLSGPALAGASSLKEMLTTVSSLDEGEQQRFVELYTVHRSNMRKFWEVVKDEFPDKAERIKVDGQLGFLTINNAPLMKALHTLPAQHDTRLIRSLNAAEDEMTLSDPVQLALLGYHRAEAWKPLLTDDIPVPREIPGDTDEVKQFNYAAYLAAQVRLSYPTAAVAEMVISQYVKVEAPGQVSAFLAEHQSKFEIGVQPVERYIARNNLEVSEETVTQVKRLERVYQITPNDGAMSGLMKHGLDAAYHVVRYNKEAFVRTFAEDLGGEDHASLTYDRSVQVHNVVLNLAVSYLTAKNGIALGSLPLAQPDSASDTLGRILQPAPQNPAAMRARALVRDEAAAAENAGDVIAYGTLETLFGEMDFCTCDHCRSILSPAAYLVDLLQFIDQPKPPDGTANPQTVLFDRRPDIQYLPLTCENTNTALPYIDVVNETLEYYIANDVKKLSLKNYVGNDTNDAKSEDLLASPQFVMESAYNTLRNERFPSPLPFHQPLENLRRYFDKFEVSLPLAMERFRKSSDVERGTNSYGWRDILMEEVGLSRAEYEILTDSSKVPLWRMYGLPDGTSDDDVINKPLLNSQVRGATVAVPLSNAKAFTRRIGISYEDIIAILRTRFVNPNSDLIPKLERLGVPFSTLKALKDGKFPDGRLFTDADFLAHLPQGAGAPNPSEYDGDIVAWVKKDANYARIMDIITLARPTGGSDLCTFDTLEFRKSKPMANAEDTSTRLGAPEFVRLLRFIRLWKKMGWTIEQTDAAICALYRTDLKPLSATDNDTVQELDVGFLTLLPRLGIVFRVFKVLNLTAKRDLLPLLACWSEIGTHGDSALYRQMFLNPAVSKQDPVFADNGYGKFLQDNTQKLICHSEALRSAFNLTDVEYSSILAALGFVTGAEVAYEHPNASLEQAILDVAPGIEYDHINKRLKHRGCFSIEERDALKAVAGATQSFKDAVDALYQATQASFTELTLTNISAIFRRGWLARKLKLSAREFILITQLTGLDPFAAPDLMDPAILRLISFVKKLKGRSLKSSAALYLVWNQDLSGKFVPDSEQVAAFGRSLRLDLAAVETEFAITDDPDGAIAQAKMTLVYGSDASAFFFGLLNNTFGTEVDFSDPDGTLAPGVTRDAIDVAAGNTDAGATKISYDNFRKRLTYTGVLSEPVRDAIKLAAGGAAAAFKTAVDDLYAKNKAAIDPFFARYAELKLLHDAYVADVALSVNEKRSRLLKKILPELIKRRKDQQALQVISVAAQIDLDFARTLLAATSAVIPLHAADHADQPALKDLLALEEQGLSVQFFANDTATGAVIPFPGVTEILDYAPAVGGVGNSLPANPADVNNAISGIWRGFVEAPENGFFNFIVKADAGAMVKLRLHDKNILLIQDGAFHRNANPIELRAGSLYKIELTVEKVRQIVRIQWEWEPKGQGRAVIPPRFLYPAMQFDAFKKTYMRFLKVSELATTLRLTADEFVYFGTHADYSIAGDGWLNVLPVIGNPSVATAAALLKPFEALLDYAGIKFEISPNDESLLTCVLDPVAATVKADSLLFTLTRWDRVSLIDVLVHFGTNAAGLTHFDNFRRVFDTFALIRTMGIPASALIRATTNEPSGDTVRDFQSALRARYDAAAWRDVVKPINDTMRGLQRDALLAYILDQMRTKPESAHIDTPDKLFEYFLMDVQMEPCMQTSRIRHALSTVQLFIDRCFMNLEPRVSPASLNAKQWEWMKRYRVWEANRKVFLFPENWLEPELRYDKSPFFKEIESELLQSDITEDSAATALLNYLTKLEEVAKLEPCGIHYVESKSAIEDGISHVVARTPGANRKYYYRRREYGPWTPWEQIKLDVEDNPVIPVVWKNRVFLFWLRILTKGPMDAQIPTSSDGRLTQLTTDNVKAVDTKVMVEAVLCWSEYYNNKWQPTKTSDFSRPTFLGKFQQSAFDRSALRLFASEESDGLRIEISGQGPGSSFLLYNTHSSPIRQEDEEFDIGFIGFTIVLGSSRYLDTSNNTFTINYHRGIALQNPDGTWPDFNLSRPVLKNTISDRTIEPRHFLNSVWTAPFFYEDARHVFYVRTAEEVVFIPQWTWYGIPIIPAKPEVFTIPPLVLIPIEIIPDRIGPLATGPNVGVVDPVPIERFVAADAFINKGIGTTGQVQYGSVNIGPAGGLFTRTLR